MNFKIDMDGDPGGIIAAEKYARTHVVVRKSDLRKIARWAKTKGLYAELKAIGVEMQEIALSGVSTPPPSKPARRRRR